MFYKGKYMLAVYNKEDYCEGVFDNIKELNKFLGYADKTVFYAINRTLDKDTLSFRVKDYNIYLIDFKVTKDCFEEEDILFKKCIINELLDNCLPMKEATQIFNISNRTYFRWKNNGKLKKNINKIKADYSYE